MNSAAASPSLFPLPEAPTTPPASPRTRRKVVAPLSVCDPIPARVKCRPRPASALGIVDQIVRAFRPRHRLAMIIGFILGGFMPLASFFLKVESASEPRLWILIGGALAFSAITVFEWTRRAFQNPIKAIGFVLVLDGVMVFSHNHYLSCAALFILVFINGTASGCKIASERYMR